MKLMNANSISMGLLVVMAVLLLQSSVVDAQIATTKYWSQTYKTTLWPSATYSTRKPASTLAPAITPSSAATVKPTPATVKPTPATAKPTPATAKPTPATAKPTPAPTPAPGNGMTMVRFQMTNSYNVIRANPNWAISELKQNLAVMANVTEDRITHINIGSITNSNRTDVSFAIVQSNKATDTKVSNAYTSFLERANKAEPIKLSVQGGSAGTTVKGSVSTWQDNMKCTQKKITCPGSQRCHKDSSSSSTCLCSTCSVTALPKHIQFVADIPYSNVSGHLSDVAKQLKVQVANITGISPARIYNVVIQELPTNPSKTVVTFDVVETDKHGAKSPLQVANLIKYSNDDKNNSPNYVIMGETVKAQRFTTLHWQDGDTCLVNNKNVDCTFTNKKCWKLQNSHSCECFSCPVKPAEVSGGGLELELYAIIIIAVVASVVALVIVIIVVFCVLRSSRKNDKDADSSYAGSHSSLEEEQYNSNFNNIHNTNFD